MAKLVRPLRIQTQNSKEFSRVGAAYATEFELFGINENSNDVNRLLTATGFSLYGPGNENRPAGLFQQLLLCEHRSLLHYFEKEDPIVRDLLKIKETLGETVIRDSVEACLRDAQ